MFLSWLGITVYKDVMSMVKMILFSPEKFKLRNISSAWLLSFMYEGSDLTMGVMTLSYTMGTQKAAKISNKN